MRAERHRRQFCVGLGGARRPRDGEERQRVLVADPVEAAHRPQGLAPVEAERAEGVGVGEPLEHGRAEPAPEPKVAHGIVPLPSPLDEPAHVVLADADDLPEAQAHRAFSADMLDHRGVAGVDLRLPSPLAGEGLGVRGSSR